MKNILIIWRTFCIMERLCKWERFFVEPSMPITTPKSILTVLEKVTFNSGITNNAWQHTKSLKTHCSALETHPITHVKTFNSDMVICCYHWIYHIFAALHKQLTTTQKKSIHFMWTQTSPVSKTNLFTAKCKRKYWSYHIFLLPLY